MAVSLNDNVLEVYNAPLPAEKKSDIQEDPSRTSSIDLQGHRSDIRAVALSANDDLLASASHSKLFFLGLLGGFLEKKPSLRKCYAK